MGSKELLMERLEETTRIVEWVILKIPQERILEAPPHGRHPHSDKGFKTYFGGWSAYRLLFHLTFYEEVYALPTMRHWLAEPHPEVDLIFPNFDLEEAAWHEELERGPDLPALMERFRAVRQEQIRALERIPGGEWHRERADTGLERVSADFAVTKTIQHALEHGDTLLRNVLYWERALDWLGSQA